MLKSLHLQIDPHSGLPVYRQVMDQVRYYVASGSLQSGDQLPSIRELAQTLTVNPATIVKAYSELEHEGVMEMRQGKGAFISLRAVRMSRQERGDRLRQLARRLAVESAQMGATAEEALQAVQAELDELEAGQDLVNAAPSPVRRIAHG